VAVNIRNVSTTEKRSTIGVMSIWGDFVGNLIFGILLSLLINLNQKINLY
jgi:hypothetical protein